MCLDYYLKLTKHTVATRVKRSIGALDFFPETEGLGRRSGSERIEDVRI